MNTLKTIVVMPAYNAEQTLLDTINDIPFEYVDELILVDDASKDGTVALAEKVASTHPTLGPKKIFTVVRHDKNKGYGGNQKTCYRIALEHGADIVVMLHPDYQYDPKLVKYFVEFIRDGYFDVMLGSRIRSRDEALEGGMPAYKYYANRILSFIQNIATGRSLSEWHTGMRAYTKEVLQGIDYDRFSDDFIFDIQVLFAIVERGNLIGDIPVPVRYFKEASSINFSRSVRYGILTLWETAKFVVRTRSKFFRYLVAGSLSFAMNFGVYAFLLQYMQMWFVQAAFIGFWAGAVVSFTLHKFWTFKRYSLKRIHSEIISYIALVLLNSGINSVILLVLVHQLFLGTLVANILSNGVVVMWTFFVLKSATFGGGKAVSV